MEAWLGGRSSAALTLLQFHLVASVFFSRWEQEGHPLLEFIRKEPNSLCTDEKKARKEKKHERTNHILYMLVLH